MGKPAEPDDPEFPLNRNRTIQQVLWVHQTGIGRISPICCPECRSWRGGRIAIVCRGSLAEARTRCTVCGRRSRWVALVKDVEAGRPKWVRLPGPSRARRLSRHGT